MKKVLVIIVLLLCTVGMYFGLSSNNNSTYDYSDEHVYAIKDLGYMFDDFSLYPDIELVELEGDEYYYIEPRYNQKIEIYKNSMEDARRIFFKELEAGKPFILKCNESNIYSNVTVVFYDENGDFIELSPYKSLKDDSLIINEYGYEIKE